MTLYIYMDLINWVFIVPPPLSLFFLLINWKCFFFHSGMLAGMRSAGDGGVDHIYMCRVLPKLMPLCVAPLFEPYCNEMTLAPARICSSLKFRTFLSASFGPIDGLPKVWACNESFFFLNKKAKIKWFPYHTLRPSDCRQMTTELRFWRSHRSTLWNVSCGGTPNCLAWSKKAVCAKRNNYFHFKWWK